jgi:flagellar hook protein FlgE
MTASALFNTAVMGMSAQTSALGSIAENISNSSTIGYKEATTQFKTILTNFSGGGDIGGGVSTATRFRIGTQGGLQSTTSATDLAIEGKGFFVVSNSAGEAFLTRAGSFVVDTQGRLVNSAGYYLMGAAGAVSVSGGLNDLQVIKINTGKLIANPTTSGTLSANLQANAPVIAPANLPSGGGTSYSYKTSVTTYDNLGNSVKLDVYFSNTGSGNWEMDVFDASTAAPGGGFPYTPPTPLATQTLTFDPNNGSLLSGSPLAIPVPNGQSMSLDLSNMTQLGAPSGVNNVSVNGNGASAVSSIQVSKDGTLSYSLSTGQTIPAYTIALANVNSPDNLEPMTGNVFAPTIDSGQAFIGNAGKGQFGTINSNELEGSTVDLATQLSNMIVAQRSYTANSQVFQVASDVLQVLNNLK